jgi:hypothetical protein
MKRAQLFSTSLTWFAIRERGFLLSGGLRWLPTVIAYEKEGNVRMMRPEVYNSLIARYGTP